MPLIGACGNGDTRPDTQVAGAVFSVNCEFGWSDCYAEARRRCSNGEYEEIDRAAIERQYNDHATMSGADLEGQTVNRSIVVQCK